MPYMRYSRKVSRKVRHPRCLLLLLVNWGERFCDHLECWGAVSGLTPPLRMVDPNIASLLSSVQQGWKLTSFLIYSFETINSAPFPFCFEQSILKDKHSYLNRKINASNLNIMFGSITLFSPALHSSFNFGQKGRQKLVLFLSLSFSLSLWKNATLSAQEPRPLCRLWTDTCVFLRFGTKLKPLILTWSYGRLGRSLVACGGTSLMRKNRTI